MRTSTLSKPSTSAPRKERRRRLELLPPLTEIQAEKARRRLWDFVRYAWHVLEPDTPFEDNWHIGAICEHLEAVSSGQIKRLIINVPPGHMKSLTTAVFWPCWYWLRRPAWKSIFVSYGYDLSERDSIKCRTLLQSNWFRETFRPEWEFDPAMNRLDHFKNTKMGERQALSVGGGATGFRGDAIIVDDPTHAIDAYSRVKRASAIQWWGKAMSNRLNSPKHGVKVIIAQRLHEGDLPGHLLKQGGFEHLMLPSRYEPARKCKTSIGFKDPRKKKDELLFPQVYGEPELAEAKRDLGSDGFAAQHQQSPAPAEGSMFKRAWFNKRWRRPGDSEVEGVESVVLDPKQHRWRSVILVVDCAFKKTLDTDRVCIGVMGYEPPDRYLLDMAWEQMGFSGTIRAILDLRSKWPKARSVIIEDKANGPAVIEVLKKKVSGVIEVQPLGGKEARAAAVSPDVEAGNLILPADAPWVADYIQEMITFPKSEHDDAVDMTSYGLMRLSSSSASERFRKLVKTGKE